MDLVPLAPFMIIIAAALFYYSIPNVIQGRMLSNPLTLGDLKNRVGRMVVVYGSPEPLEEIFTRHKIQILWQKRSRQVYTSGHRRGYWKTTKVKGKRTDFHLHFPDGGRVYVVCNPSEVQGGGRATGGAHGIRTHGSERAITEWLPLTENLTVMGKLVLEEEGATVVPHEKHGLFFSPAPPEAAARKELAKGVGGLVLASGLTVGFLYLVFAHFLPAMM